MDATIARAAVNLRLCSGPDRGGPAPSAPCAASLPPHVFDAAPQSHSGAHWQERVQGRLSHDEARVKQASDDTAPPRAWSHGAARPMSRGRSPEGSPPGGTTLRRMRAFLSGRSTGIQKVTSAVFLEQCQNEQVIFARSANILPRDSGCLCNSPAGTTICRFPLTSRAAELQLRAGAKMFCCDKVCFCFN